MASKIQFRRDTSAQWSAVNPTLAQGEFGLDLDTMRFKLGTGALAWSLLPWYTADTASLSAAISGKLDASVYQSASGAWESTYSTVGANSAQWAAGTSGGAAQSDLLYVSGQVSGKLDASVYQSASGAWASAYSTVASNSAAWSSTSVYDATFTSASLVGGILPVTHNLGRKYVVVTVVDSDNRIVVPSDVTFSTTGVLSADLTVFAGMSGTWSVHVFGKMDASAYAGTSGSFSETTSTVAANSGRWESAYSTTAANSAAWGAAPSGIVYTGTAERTVGGISEGQSFSGATMSEMWDALIKQEKFPTLVSPSSTFTSTVEGYREVGGAIASIAFASSFSRGSITPQYTALSPLRSGPPNAHQYTGTGLASVSTSSLTDSQTVTGYTVLINGQSWQGRVAYDDGVQPKSSYGNDYSTPLAAGSTSYVTRTITGVYPYYASTATIGTMTKQALASHSSSYVQTNMVAEDDSSKQEADFPAAWSAITGVQFYNTINSTWEWIGGSKANSLLTFDAGATTYSIQGSTINYTTYTNNGSKSGARQLRWYTT